MIKMSESTENIFKSLSAFKKDFKQPKKDTQNPFFKSKYVDLDSVVDALDSVLPEYKMTYMQNITTDDNNRVGVQTIIIHESGESIEFDWLFITPDKNTAQGVGSAITYGRRYTLTSAFGIASEADDDGNKASGNSRNNNPQPRKKKKPKLINKGDIKKINEKVKELAELSDGDQSENEKKYENWIKGQAKVDNLDQIPKQFLDSLINALDRMITKSKTDNKKVKQTEQTSLMDGNTTTAKGEK